VEDIREENVKNDKRRPPNLQSTRCIKEINVEESHQSDSCRFQITSERNHELIQGFDGHNLLEIFESIISCVSIWEICNRGVAEPTDESNESNTGDKSKLGPMVFLFQKQQCTLSDQVHHHARNTLSQISMKQTIKHYDKHSLV
jgi:hypothetical protein